MALPAAVLPCLIAALCGPSSAAGATVYTFPIPGSRVASPYTQIVFRGVPASRLGAIFVSGSRSGAHSGRVKADSDGDGGSFLPFKRFTAGETVTVRTNLNIYGAAKHGTFHFKVAAPAGNYPPSHWPYPSRHSGDVWNFHSRPDIKPAAVRTSVFGRTSRGYIFVSAQFGPQQDGPEILDNQGNVVWFKRLKGDDSVTNFRAQRYRGKPVLTWWQGYVTGGNGLGEDVINDTSYRQIATVRCANGMITDLHEFEITRNNTALLNCVFPVFWDARSVGLGARHVVFDDVIQEVDIATGLVVFEWDSLDHVPLTDTYAPLPNGGVRLDYIHTSSADLDADGNVLISGRNTFAVYKANHNTARTIWTLGGKHSSFSFGSGATFAYQHDVEVHSTHDWFITMFDDGAGATRVHSQSRGLKLFLDVKHKIATAIGQVEHSPPLLATYEGNYQQLPNRDVFIGWGSAPYFSEYNVHGSLVFDAHFVDSEPNYRAYRCPWSAQPDRHHPPAVAAAIRGSHTTVWASWNGATDVAGWRVLGGSGRSRLRTLGRAARNGFETWITVPVVRYVAVEALDGRGHVLARSRTVGT